MYARPEQKIPRNAIPVQPLRERPGISLHPVPEKNRMEVKV
jgi:hypothetical protein